MKKILINLTLLTILSVIISGCDPENVIGKDTTKDETATDYLWDDNNVKTITFNQNSITSSSVDVMIAGTTATITAGGYYAISGNLTDGQLIVNAPKAKLKIMLNGVTMSNTTTAPFFIQSASKVIVFLKKGTTSTFSDPVNYINTGEPQATFFSNAYLAFTGEGTLNVTGNHNDAISCDDEVIINSGNFNINALDDGIRGKNYINVHNGIINVQVSTGHALKSDNTETAGRGYVKINGGNLTLTSAMGDGINTSKRILIENGKLSLTSLESQGLRSDSLVHIYGGDITVMKNSKQGIKSPFITLSGGTTQLTTNKIAINATYETATTQPDSSRLTISGGNLYINTLSHGLVSDGNIHIGGGTTVIQGPYDNSKVVATCLGDFIISNGLFVGSGPNAGTLIKNPGSTSTQNSLKISSSSLGSNLINIQDAGGNSLVTFKPIKSAYYLQFSSPALKTGNSFSVFTGGSYSGGTTVNGYSTGGSYNAGTRKSTFSVSEKVTLVNF